MPIDDLDAIFRDQLQSFAFSDEEISAHFSDASDVIKQKENERQALLREKQKLEREMKRWIPRALPGGIVRWKNVSDR